MIAPVPDSGLSLLMFVAATLLVLWVASPAGRAWLLAAPAPTWRCSSPGCSTTSLTAGRRVRQLDHYYAVHHEPAAPPCASCAHGQHYTACTRHNDLLALCGCSCLHPARPELLARKVAR